MISTLLLTIVIVVIVITITIVIIIIVMLCVVLHRPFLIKKQIVPGKEVAEGAAKVIPQTQTDKSLFCSLTQQEREESVCVCVCVCV